MSDVTSPESELVALGCNCSVATAKSRFFRVWHKLKEALAKQCDFYHDKERVFRCDRKA